LFSIDFAIYVAGDNGFNYNIASEFSVKYVKIDGLKNRNDNLTYFDDMDQKISSKKVILLNPSIFVLFL
jgi:hypothetical protein